MPYCCFTTHNFVTTQRFFGRRISELVTKSENHKLVAQCDTIPAAQIYNYVPNLFHRFGLNIWYAVLTNYCYHVTYIGI